MIVRGKGSIKILSSWYYSQLATGMMIVLLGLLDCSKINMKNLNPLSTHQSVIVAHTSHGNKHKFRAIICQCIIRGANGIWPEKKRSLRIQAMEISTNSTPSRRAGDIMYGRETDRDLRSACRSACVAPVDRCVA